MTALAVRPGRTSRPGRVRTPAPQSLPTEVWPDGRLGRNDLGRLTVADGVVARLAARVALEVDDVGAAAPRLLGQDLSAAGRVGLRTTRIGALPSASATVDGGLAFVELTLSVRWPRPVRQVAAEVRTQVRERLRTLTGLEVAEVDITVAALVAAEPVRRVR